MSDTPRTDECLSACLRSGGRHSGQIKSSLNIYQVARKMESGLSHAINALKIREEANQGAAKTSPQCADWSNGVAAGNREAINILERIATQRTQ